MAVFLSRSLQIGPAYRALLRNKDKFHLLETNIYNDNSDAITNVVIEKTLANSIRKKDKRLLREVLKLNTDTGIFNNDNVIKLHYFWGTKEYGKYIGLAEDKVPEKYTERLIRMKNNESLNFNT